jgi:C-terminal processing protease CtpA/Prc/Tol biopolymer transport system component
MHQLRFPGLVLAGIFFTQLVSAQNNLLLRHPAVNNNGSQVAFSYQGDIWTVPASGGTASRLTIHPGYEAGPLYSPDGSTIAFTGSRYGNADIFSIPAAGGPVKQLTYNSAGDIAVSWNGNNEVVFSTSREFKQIERPFEVYAIQVKGGTERRLLDAVCHDPAYSPDGRYLALVRGDINPVAREDYDGPSNRELWLYDKKTRTYEKLPGFTTNDIMPKWAGNRTLYFLSSADGTYNLYKLAIGENGKAAGSPEKLTNFKEDAIRHFDISSDGSTLVFEKDLNLFIAKTSDVKNMRKLAVTINADDRLDPNELKTFTTGMNNYSISPSGKWIAFEQRGEIFVKEANKDKSRSVNVSNHPYRDQSPVWVNDSVLLFSSDRNDGNFDFYVVKSSDPTQKDLYWSLKQTITRVTNTPLDESDPVVSNKGKQIVFNRGAGSFLLANLDSTGKMSGEKVLVDEKWTTPGEVTWSPDDKFLAYTMTDLYANYEVMIHPLDGKSKPVNVSMHPRTDRSPVWSPDGSKLGFISARNNRTDDVWFVWLKQSDWEKTRPDWTDSPEEPKKDSKDKGKQPVAITIDFENIHERVVQVTSFSGNESNLAISSDGEVFYYTTQSSTATGSDLYSIKWNGEDLKELTKGGSNPAGVRMDAQGANLYLVRRGALARINTKTAAQEALPYAAKMKIDYAAEREQIFEEGWRAIRDGFYDPNMHGYNWKNLHDEYKPACMAASTTEDFRDMFNLMLGELNASHMGMSNPARIETQTVNTANLGAELEPVPGGMKVVRVIPQTPADRKGSKLSAGDVIISVNGSPVSASGNFYEGMNGLANEQILLQVKGADGATREVALRPTASVREQLYQEWVNDRKKLVDQYSNGRIGYIHVQGMNMPSFEVMEREFTAAGYGKDAIIIDVRYNGGGSTTDYLMAVLNYKQHAYTVPRGASDNLEKDKLKFRDYYPTGERLVYAAWLKPSIAICNEGSYSNAEIFSHAYKQLGVGKLVGQPTNGSVISTGAQGLMDGSMVRMPRRGWFTKATDKNQELGPAVPDILVENDVDWIGKKEDKQLKVAVETLLKDLKGK